MISFIKMLGGLLVRELINNIKESIIINIKEEKYIVKTKTWYSIREDSNINYVKIGLSQNKC